MVKTSVFFLVIIEQLVWQNICIRLWSWPVLIFLREAICMIVWYLEKMTLSLKVK